MSTHNIEVHDKIREFPWILVSLSCRRISLALKNEFELAMVNEPSVFELLMFDCMYVYPGPNWPVAFTFTFNNHKSRSTVHFRYESQNILHTTWNSKLITCTGNTCLRSNTAYTYKYYKAKATGQFGRPVQSNFTSMCGIKPEYSFSLNMLWNNYSRQHLKIFFVFFQKIGFGISGKIVSKFTRNDKSNFRRK